jgi:hypothetical protein
LFGVGVLVMVVVVAAANGARIRRYIEIGKP